MTRPVRTALTALIFLSLASSLTALPSRAAYLKIGDITADGEWTELLSFSFGVEREIVVGDCAAARRGADDRRMRDITFAMGIDKASPGLLEAMTEGQSYDEVEIQIREGGERCTLSFLKIEIAEVERDRRAVRAHLRFERSEFMKIE